MALGKKKEMIGTVLSRKMNKTAIVEVSRKVEHPFYHRYHITRKKYKAHDERNECGPGDRVLMRECPPISREKRWVITQVIEKGSEV